MPLNCMTSFISLNKLYSNQIFCRNYVFHFHFSAKLTTCNNRQEVGFMWCHKARGKGYWGRRRGALWSRRTAPPWGGWGCWRCRSVWASGSRTPWRTTCRLPAPTCGGSSSSRSASPSEETTDSVQSRFPLWLTSHSRTFQAQFPCIQGPRGRKSLETQTA